MRRIFKISFIMITFLVLLLYIFDVVNSLKRVSESKVEFSIHFEKGSSESDLDSFVKDFKEKYKDVEIVEYKTDEENIEEAIKRNKVKESEKDKYTKDVEDYVTAEIKVLTPVVGSMGSLKEFNIFMSKTLSMYNTLALRQYSGSVPENFLKPGGKIQTILWSFIPTPVKALIFMNAF